ncbi:MAG: guanylate kinase [Nitrospiraceae bacterium]|nr:guanylate kinase [Nitrospiraceae bacterium]
MASVRKKKTRGSVFIISAPSGAGKSTLCTGLMGSLENIRPSVSYTTRAPRHGEVNDVHYTFISEKKFRNMIGRGEFAEWAEVHGNLYGTSAKRLKSLIRAGVDILLDIDVQGADKIRTSLEDGVYIFIMPPSLKVLRSRLEKRMGHTRERPEDVARRLAKAREEMRRYNRYDYVIINDDLQTARREFESIIIAERLKSGLLDSRWVKKTIFQQEE